MICISSLILIEKKLPVFFFEPFDLTSCRVTSTSHPCPCCIFIIHLDCCTFLHKSCLEGNYEEDRYHSKCNITLLNQSRIWHCNIHERRSLYLNVLIIMFAFVYMYKCISVFRNQIYVS